MMGLNLKWNGFFSLLNHRTHKNIYTVDNQKKIWSDPVGPPKRTDILMQNFNDRFKNKCYL